MLIDVTTPTPQSVTGREKSMRLTEQARHAPAEEGVGRYVFLAGAAKVTGRSLDKQGNVPSLHLKTY